MNMIEVSAAKTDSHLPSDVELPEPTWSEHLVRWVLLVGFVGVLVMEAWLLWSAWGQVF